MNFENMSELHPETNPSVPGVKIMWYVYKSLSLLLLFYYYIKISLFFFYFITSFINRLISLVVYSAFLIMSIHFRILYSAT